MKKALTLLAFAVAVSSVSFVSCSEQSSDVSSSVTENSVQSENVASTKVSTVTSSATEEIIISDSDDPYKLEADQIVERYVKSLREETEEAFEYISEHTDLDHKHSLDKKYGIYQKELQYFFDDFERERQENVEFLYDAEYIGKLDEALYENVDMYYWNDYGWYEIRNQYGYDDPRTHIDVLRGYEYELMERRISGGEVVSSDTERFCVIFVDGQGWKILCASSEEIASNDHYKTDDEQFWSD